MNAPNISIEDRTVFAALAVAIANTLECPETPRELADVLLEILNPLEDVLTKDATAYQTCAMTLRSLAAMAENGDGRARPEIEKEPISQMSAKSGA